MSKEQLFSFSVMPKTLKCDNNTRYDLDIMAFSVKDGVEFMVHDTLVSLSVSDAVAADEGMLHMVHNQYNTMGNKILANPRVVIQRITTMMVTMFSCTVELSVTLDREIIEIDKEYNGTITIITEIQDQYVAREPAALSGMLKSAFGMTDTVRAFQWRREREPDWFVDRVRIGEIQLMPISAIDFLFAKSYGEGETACVFKNSDTKALPGDFVILDEFQAVRGMHRAEFVKTYKKVNT